MSTFETIDITLIDVNPDVYPRVGPDDEIVETYRLHMEDGVKFPPLVVQKDTYTLIDGLHRYRALQKLAREKVEVEILDIPDNELRAESIRRNSKHGKRLTSREIAENIVALRFKDFKKEKDIAEIVGLSEGRISQICNERRSMPRYLPELSNFRIKDTKIDLRTKVDEEEILEDLKSGMQGKEIAKKHGISQPRVSQIKKKYEEWVSSPVYIKMEPYRALEMFNYAFANKLLKKARIEFKENGVFIRNSAGKKPPFVVAVFPPRYFIEYRVNDPIDGYVETNILKHFRDIEQDQFELALMDEKTWIMRWGGQGGSKMYENVDWRELQFPLTYVEFDKDGIPKNCTVKAEISPKAITRKEKGELTLKMVNKKLYSSFKSGDGWECTKDVELDFLEKAGNATAYVDLTTVNEILKLFNTAVWIGMWSDHSGLAIGQGSKENTVCFII